MPTESYLQSLILNKVDTKETFEAMRDKGLVNEGELYLIEEGVTVESIGAAPLVHKHTKSDITDFPSSMPASDVYEWAKKSTKPSYTASEVGAPTVQEMEAAIAAIPTPDVSGQIGVHNTSTEAHKDIRDLIDNKIAQIPTPDVSGQINSHNSSNTAHDDIRKLVAAKADTSSLAKVATSGSYKDLINQPTAADIGAVPLDEHDRIHLGAGHDQHVYVDREGITAFVDNNEVYSSLNAWGVHFYDGTTTVCAGGWDDWNSEDSLQDGVAHMFFYDENGDDIRLRGIANPATDRDAANKAYVDNAIASAGADWDQNDSTHPDYIKNRTHYKNTIDFDVTLGSEHTWTASHTQIDGVMMAGYYVLGEFPADFSPQFYSVDEAGRTFVNREFNKAFRSYGPPVDFAVVLYYKGTGVFQVHLYSSVEGMYSIRPRVYDVGNFSTLHEAYIPNTIARTSEVDSVSTKVSGLVTPLNYVADSTEELQPGENIHSLFSKIAAGIRDLLSHLSNKKNPHSVTAAQVGAVASDGSNAMTGNLTITKSVIPSVTLNGAGTGWSRVYKNASESVENGLHLKDVDTSGNEAEFQLIAMNELSRKLVLSADGKSYSIYHEGNKPTAADVGAVSNTGGTMKGTLAIQPTGINGYSQIYKNATSDSSDWGTLLIDRDATNAMYGLKLRAAAKQARITDGTNEYDIYHTGNKPTPADIGALSANGTAASASKLATARTINGMSFDGSSAINNYGVCSTAAATAAKTVTVGGSFSLVAGSQVKVKFTYANSAANPTLNVNGTGAKYMRQYGSKSIGTDPTTSGWSSGAIVTFTYDGTDWVRDYWYNTATSTAPYFVGTLPPPGNTTSFWIDTSIGGVLKYYEGGEWIAVKSVWG